MRDPNQLALSFAGDAYDDMERLKHPADADALKGDGAPVDIGRDHAVR
ncbi:hypothetical protein V4R08_11270 [Nitrobacter sp. NHB1]